LEVLRLRFVKDLEENTVGFLVQFLFWLQDVFWKLRKRLKNFEPV